MYIENLVKGKFDVNIEIIIKNTKFKFKIRNFFNTKVHREISKMGEDFYSEFNEYAEKYFI